MSLQQFLKSTLESIEVRILGGQWTGHKAYLTAVEENANFCWVRLAESTAPPDYWGFRIPTSLLEQAPEPAHVVG